MSDRTKAKVAFAEAITQTLWIKGLITAKERDQSLRKPVKSCKKAIANSVGSFEFGLDFSFPF